MTGASGYDDRGPNSFEPDLSPVEEAFGETLASRRVLPRAAFRGELSRHLDTRDAGLASRPENLWRLVAVWATVAVVVFVAALLVAAG